jgi:hypothetical protein
MKMNRRAGVVCAAAAAVTLGTVLPSQAVVGWRPVYGKHYGAAANLSTFGAVVALSKKNIWALGGTDRANGFSPSGSPVAVHWNGSGWASVPMPAGAVGTIGTASAVSASDIWAATVFGGSVLHYNGTRWSVAKHLPQPTFSATVITGITALGPTNVWVFGGGNGPAIAQGTWHYDGRKWTQWLGIADGLATASALSPKDIWAVRGELGPAMPGIERFNGRSWKLLTAKALAGLAFGGITAFSDKDVWVTAAFSVPPFTRFLLHYDGTRWSRVVIPWPAVLGGAVVRDGHGGLWLTGVVIAANHTGKWYAMHRTAAGAWSRVAITDGSLWDLAHIPGTASEISVGDAFSKTVWNAMIWAYGAL